MRRLEDASDVLRFRDQEEPHKVFEALFDMEYQRYLEGGSGLVYDEEEQAFYTSGGELALSRTYANLEHVFGSL